MGKGPKILVWLDRNDPSGAKHLEECETKAEALLWASKQLFEAGLAELLTRINTLDTVEG